MSKTAAGPYIVKPVGIGALKLVCHRDSFAQVFTIPSKATECADEMNRLYGHLDDRLAPPAPTTTDTEMLAVLAAALLHFGKSLDSCPFCRAVRTTRTNGHLTHRDECPFVIAKVEGKAS